MTREWMTVPEVAAHLGCNEDRAPKIMSEHSIRAIRVYPADAVRAITRAGQGARTDLRTRHDDDAGATADLGSWGRYVIESRMSGTVTHFLGDYAEDYDLDALVDAFRAAVNAELDGTGIAMAGNEFYGTRPVPEDSTELIQNAIDAVDLADLAQAHERT